MKLPACNTTLKRRLLWTMAIGLLLNSALLLFISYDSIRSVDNDRLSGLLTTEILNQAEKMEEDFTSLLQITQQFTPIGIVGSLVEEYLQADQQFDRVMALKDLTSNMGLVAHSNTNTVLLTYYDPKNRQELFANLPLMDGFQPEDSLPLYRNSDVMYCGIRPTQLRNSEETVIALVRNVSFGNGRELQIYVEMRSTLPQSIDELSRAQKLPLQFFQLTPDGTICYSTHGDHWHVGDKVELTAATDTVTTGKIDGYYWYGKAAPQGYSNFILIPLSSYNSLLWEWQLKTVGVLVLTVFVMLLLTLALWSLLYRPIKLLGGEIARMGTGDLSRAQHEIGIEEFDRLFDKFENMKLQINRLLMDIEEQEAEKRKLEIEKIYFQINPHFLLNSLNSVHWLAKIHQQREISRFAAQLNHILSYSLSRTDANATLRTEIQVLNAYVEIQSMRYNFHYNEEVEEGEYLDLPAPRLILQPIVENAISHGIEEGGLVSLIVRRGGDGDVCINIYNDGDIYNAPDLPPLGRGIGLRYVRMALESFYRNKAELKICGEAHGTTVHIRLPVGEVISG